MAFDNISPIHSTTVSVISVAMGFSALHDDHRGPNMRLRCELDEREDSGSGSRSAEVEDYEYGATESTI